MLMLKIDADKVFTLGNLKYDVLSSEAKAQAVPSPFKEDHLDHQVLVAGSTHEGEEEIIFRSFAQIIQEFPLLRLILAPRNIERAPEIEALARRYNLNASLRSTGEPSPDNILILDTLGELTSIYALADIALVGGSLVNLGGHNPIEPASQGAVTLFGPHMDDFSEITADILSANAAFQLNNEQDLTLFIRNLLSDNAQLKTISANALNFIASRHGVVDRHIQLIRELL